MKTVTTDMTSSTGPGTPTGVEASLIARINRLEGQVRGIRRMVEEGRPCLDTLQQIASLRSAAGAIGLALLEAYLRDSASSALSTGQREGMGARTAEVLRRYIRS